MKYIYLYLYRNQSKLVKEIKVIQTEENYLDLSIQKKNWEEQHSSNIAVISWKKVQVGNPYYPKDPSMKYVSGNR